MSHKCGLHINLDIRRLESIHRQRAFIYLDFYVSKLSVRALGFSIMQFAHLLCY